MDEPAALTVAAIRALETAEEARPLWSDADRSWASRAAAEVVGESALPGVYLARRAGFALERLAARHKALGRAARALRWRPWVGAAIVALAFAAGLAGDRIGGSQRINILAPPVLVLLVWNLTVFAMLAAGFVVRYGERVPGGPLRRAVARLAGGAVRPRSGGAIGGVIVDFAADWAQIAAPLYAARAARILHLAAATLALGVVTGLYLRGVALEYRAGWESTFLSASTVHTLVAMAYAPGAALTGIAVPGVADIDAIRAPGGENAARWLHLIAATVFALVVVPRLALALVDGLIERHRARRLPLPLHEPYYQRLLRGYRSGPARVRVLPYSYTAEPAARAGLEAIVARAFGGGAAVHVAAPIAYGSDDPLPTAPGARSGALVALFNATATPEREAQGAFLATLRGIAAPGEPVLALVDEHAFVQSRSGDAAGIEARRAAWRAVTAEAGVPIVFADLASPDLPLLERTLDTLLGERVR